MVAQAYESNQTISTGKSDICEKRQAVTLPLFSQRSSTVNLLRTITVLQGQYPSTLGLPTKLKI